MSLLYDRILFDQLGKPAFVGPFDQLQFGQPPPANVLLLISNQWTNGIGLHQDQTLITDPDGEVVIETNPTDFYLKDPAAKHRIDARLGVTLTKDGRYRISVKVDNRTELEYFFFVRFRAQTTEGGLEGSAT